MKTIFGMLVDQLGISAGTTLEQGTYGPEVRMAAHATPAAEFRHVQPARIGIDFAHDERYAGAVDYLERDKSGRLWCVGHANVDPPAWLLPLFWSGKTSALGDVLRHDVELRAVALTPHPRQIGVRQHPVVILDGELDHRGCTRRWSGQLGTWQRELLERAAAARFHRKPGEPLVIHDETGRDTTAAGSHTRSAHTELEYRSASAVDVIRPLREVDVVIAPAEQPTRIHERTRSYVETYSHGCFAGCERDPRRIKVCLDHIRARVLGRALRLDPWAEEGLTGTIKLARTRDGDEALELISERLVGFSAGFAVEADEWNGSNRRIRRAILDHVAVTGDPAYPGAEAIAVRAGLR